MALGRSPEQHPAPSTQQQQQQQPVSNQCSLLTTGTGTGDWWQHSRTHTPSAMDIGQPPGQASPGLFFISSHVAAVRLSALLFSPPPNKQQHDEILTHRF